MRLGVLRLAGPLLAALFLISCNGSPSTPNVYPGPGAYPGPADSNIPKTPVTSAEAGAVRATLVYSDGGKPVRHQLFYAAKVLPLTGGTPGAGVPSLDQATAPKGDTDGQGNLVLSLVPAGKYVLAVMLPTGPVQARDAETNAEITFEVTAGQVLDLGNHRLLLDPKILGDSP